MASTPSPSQYKGKSKRRSKGSSVSPSASSRHQGYFWTPPPPHTTTTITPYTIPSNKITAFQQIDLNLLSLFQNPASNMEANSLPGGVIDTERSRLLATWKQLEKLDISEHLPVKSDTILLNPETMRACGFSIASPVIVKGRGITNGNGEEKYICCKAWPLTSLPLDVVALGWGALQGCCVGEGERVEVAPLVTPVSRIPIANEVTLIPSDRLEFTMDTAFKNYLLHMHDGYLATPHSTLGVQYLGEMRAFKVAGLKPFLNEEECSSSLTDVCGEGEIEEKLSTLDLNETEPMCIYKITSRSRLEVVVSEVEKDGYLQKGKPPPLSEVGGAQVQIQLLREVILYPLNSKTDDGVLFPHGVILYGPSGVGKSLLAASLAGETPAHHTHLSTAQLLSQDSEGLLNKTFSDARNNCPSLIILEDLDVLCPHRDSSPSEMERRTMACLSGLLEGLHRHPPPSHVVVLATTNQIEKVEPNLRRMGKFDKEIEFHVPTSTSRLEILKILLRGRSNNLSPCQLKSLSERAHGYVGADLHAVCAEAQYKALHRKLGGGRGDGGEEGGGDVETKKVTIAYEDMLSSLREIRPSAMKEVVLEVPKVLWSDIGGQDEVKQSMMEAVEWPLKHPEVFVQLGIKPPKGILLYGPPGCSKTMAARALATESGLNFIAVKGPELFSKWVGDSEKAVRQVFRRARAASPAIVFFDEIDALAVQRKNEGSSVADRILAQLLTEMDGFESMDGVLVVAATNRPDMIDKALLRPGRIDRLIYVPLPSENTRKEIFKIQFKKVPVDNDVVVDDLVAKTAGFSGAEVVSLCQKAALCAMHEDMKSCCVSGRHFERALSAVSPQTEQTIIDFYEQFNK